MPHWATDKPVTVAQAVGLVGRALMQVMARAFI